MGRKAKPSALAAAAGNPGKRPRKPRPPRPTAIPPDRTAPDSPPEWLTHAAGLRIWSEAWPPLSQMRFARDTDRLGFARYCQYFGEWIDATRTLTRDGQTQEVKTVAGDTMVRLHPSVKAREIAERHLKDFEDRYGLNPFTRIRIQQHILDNPSLVSGDLFAAKPENEAQDAPPPAAEVDPMTFFDPPGKPH